MSADQDPAELYEPDAFDGMVNGHAGRFDVFSRFLKANGLKNVYKHGDGGAAFEARMSAVDLPPAIVSGMKLRQRLPWVREHLASVTGRVDHSPNRLAVLALAELETVRVWRSGSRHR